jgi:hypothetical protein
LKASNQDKKLKNKMETKPQLGASLRHKLREDDETLEFKPGGQHPSLECKLRASSKVKMMQIYFFKITLRCPRAWLEAWSPSSDPTAKSRS